MNPQQKKGTGLQVPFPETEIVTIATDGDGIKYLGAEDELPEVTFDPEQVGYDTAQDWRGK